MNKTLAIRVATGVLAMLGIWVAYTQTARPPQPLTIEKIKDDLFVIVGSGGNVAMYVTDEGVILVDDKFEQDNAEIVAKVKSVTDKPIKYVLNTHQHGDHTGGNAKMMGASAEILIQKNARANMVAGKMPGIPRIAYGDETQVVLGGKEVLGRYFGRGHTNGDVAIYFPAAKVVHTGDLFTVSATAGAISPLIDYSAKGSGVEWTKTLDGILNSGWDFDVVIPGHGPISKRADLMAYRTKFDAMRTKVTSMVRGGQSKDDISKMLAADFGWPATASARALDAFMAEVK
jgi:glyoxylase-like metal-dependent hydrolase (beta-lactamase superfamily II)